MGREEEKRGWEESGPPPGPTPAAPAWLSDTEERQAKRGKRERNRIRKMTKRHRRIGEEKKRWKRLTTL